MTKAAQELMKQIKEAAVAREAAVKDKIEEIKLTNELNYINSDLYETDRITDADNATIMAFCKPLDDISDKHFIRYQEFNFNHQANLIIGAIKTVLLQKRSGFEALNQERVLNKELDTFCNIVADKASEFPTAFGRNTFFDKLSGTIVDAVPHNVEKIQSILQAVSRELSLINVNFNDITESRLTLIEEKAKLKAELALRDNQLLDPKSNNDTWKQEDIAVS